MSDHPEPPQIPEAAEAGAEPHAPPPPPPGHPGTWPDSGVTPHRGLLILILGICSWMTGCFVLGIIAWAMGNRDLLEMEEGRMDPEGLGLTQGGRIAGMVHIIVSCVMLLLTLIVIIVFGTALLEQIQ